MGGAEVPEHGLEYFSVIFVSQVHGRDERDPIGIGYNINPFFICPRPVQEAGLGICE